MSKEQDFIPNSNAYKTYQVLEEGILRQLNERIRSAGVVDNTRKLLMQIVIKDFKQDKLVNVIFSNRLVIVSIDKSPTERGKIQLFESVAKDCELPRLYGNHN